MGASFSLFNVLAMTSIVILLCFMNRVMSFLPPLFSTLFRFRTTQEVFSNARLKSDCEITALCTFLPLCLILNRFDVYSPDFFQSLTPNIQLLVLIGILLLYLIVQKLCVMLFSARGSETLFAVNNVVYIYIPHLMILSFFTASIMSFAGCDAELVKYAIFWLSGALYLWLIIRKTQFLLSRFSLFTSILYLCALELIPMGILIASAVIF